MQIRILGAYQMLLDEQGEAFWDLIMLLIMIVFLPTRHTFAKYLVDDACLIL